MDYTKLINQHCQIIDGLSQEVDSVVESSDLTSILRNTGLALSNLSKLRTLQKREEVVDDDDNLDDLIAEARVKAERMNGKKA